MATTAAFVVGSDRPRATTTTATAAPRGRPAQSTTTSGGGGGVLPSSSSSPSVVAADRITTADGGSAAAPPPSSHGADDEDGGTPKQQRRQPQPRPLRVLFLSSDTGGGHRASAEALAAQFRHHFPGTTHELLDCWTDVESSWPYNTIRDTYKSFSATPWKWRALYHVSNTAAYTRLADAHSYYMNEDLIREKMETMDVDVVVSVHPTMNYVPLLAIRRISEKVGRDIPFFTVVTE